MALWLRRPIVLRHVTIPRFELEGGHVHVHDEPLTRVKPYALSVTSERTCEKSFVPHSLMPIAALHLPDRSRARCAPAAARKSAWLSVRSAGGFRAHHADAVSRLAEHGLQLYGRMNDASHCALKHAETTSDKKQAHDFSREEKLSRKSTRLLVAVRSRARAKSATTVHQSYDWCSDWNHSTGDGGGGAAPAISLRYAFVPLLAATCAACTSSHRKRSSPSQ